MKYLLAAAIMALSAATALAEEQPVKQEPAAEQATPKPPQQPVTVIRGTTVEQIDPRTQPGSVTILRGK